MPTTYFGKCFLCGVEVESAPMSFPPKYCCKCNDKLKEKVPTEPVKEAAPAEPVKEAASAEPVKEAASAEPVKEKAKSTYNRRIKAIY